MELVNLITAYKNGLMSKLEFYGKAHDIITSYGITPEQYDIMEEIILNIQ